MIGKATLIGLSVVSLVACRSTEEPQTPIYPVNLSINLQQSTYRQLLSPATITTITTPMYASDRLGFGGLALVHGWGLNEFYAYELVCPYENRADVRLEVRSIELVCPQCRTRYEVLSGSGVPIGGVGNSPLRRYRSNYNSQTKVLIVTN